MSNSDFPLCKEQGEIQCTESFHVQHQLFHFPTKLTLFWSVENKNKDKQLQSSASDRVYPTKFLISF